jgi:hypothetical protein
MMRYAMFFVLPALAAAACGGTDPVATATAPPVAPAAACQHKATWTTAVACLDCASRCVQAPCTCSPGPANGTCFDLNKKRSAACDTSVNDCVLACSTDCACLGRCYDAHAACAAASADLEGCILQTCDPSCR